MNTGAVGVTVRFRVKKAVSGVLVELPQVPSVSTLAFENCPSASRLITYEAFVAFVCGARSKVAIN